MENTKSSIHHSDIKSQGEINGRWIIECLFGTLVCDPSIDSDDLTFTAPNGKRYSDTVSGSYFTPRKQFRKMS